MLNRRTFIATAVAATAAPTFASAATLDYTPGLVAKLLKDGETVFLDFAADWCTTCKAQERRIGSLKSANPAYEANIVFVRVDWDKYGRSDIAKNLNVPRRSTLVVLKGNQELGRVVSSTSQKAIKALMDTALAAATA